MLAATATMLLVPLGTLLLMAFDEKLNGKVYDIAFLFVFGFLPFMATFFLCLGLLSDRA